MTNEPLCHVLSVFDIEAEPVTDGITRRRIHRSDFASSWLIEFAPGSCWPEVDRHTREEWYYVLRGEILEGNRCHPAGTYVRFLPGSSHRPHSRTGAVILGITQEQADYRSG